MKKRLREKKIMGKNKDEFVKDITNIEDIDLTDMQFGKIFNKLQTKCLKDKA